MMKTRILLTFTLLFSLFVTGSRAQQPMQFQGVDCNNQPVDLFADLDAGKVVVLHFYMPNCGSCPPPAQKIQTMANRINSMYPNSVKGYAFPYQDITTCTYSASWVSSNNLSQLFQPMDSGEAMVAYYGGFGMPTVVLLGGKGADKRVLFSTLNFTTSDTTEMRDSILSILNSATGVADLPSTVQSFSAFPNPAGNFLNVQMELKEAARVKLELCDLTGRTVLLQEKQQDRGLYQNKISTGDFPIGVYLLRMQVNGESHTQRFTVYH